jgi:hypothetical protein
MLALIAIAALVGATLALRFNVFSLVPTTAFVLTVVAIGLGVRGDDIWWIGVKMFATAASLQLGYLGACFLQIVLPGMAGRAPFSADHQIHPKAPPLAPHQPDRDIDIDGGRSSDESSRTVMAPSISLPVSIPTTNGTIPRGESK